MDVTFPNYEHKCGQTRQPKILGVRLFEVLKLGKKTKKTLAQDF